MKEKNRGRMLRPGAAAVVVASLALAACGGEDEPEQESALSTVETELIEAINDVREAEPAIEAVDCPEIDVAAVGETADCEVSGGGETGSLEITVAEPRRLDYSGSFGTSGFAGTGVEIPE